MRSLICLLIILSFSLRAEVYDAPVIPLDFMQNPPSIEWKELKTKHFQLIFPKDVEREAKRVAFLLEKAYPFVTRSMEEFPERIPLVLQNQSVSSNGFVTLAPRRSEWFLTPAIDPEITNTEWLKTLAIHEFRHIVQFQKGRRGFNKAFYLVLGEAGQALGLAFTMPAWFFEGDAVGIETALTKGGRGRLPLFERDLKALLLSGQKFSYDKTHLGSYEDYIPNHYVYGYFYTSWLRNEYGDLFLSKLSSDAAEYSWNPLSFYNATDRLTGERFEKFYKKVMNELMTEWKKRSLELKPTEYEIRNLGKRFGWTNFLYPQLTQKGEILALKKGLSFIEEFVLLNGKDEEHLFYPAALHNDHPFKLRNDKFAFFEVELDPRWGYRDYARLKVYDIKKREFILDKRKVKGRHAVLSESGDLGYLEWSPEQEQSLVVLDLKGNEKKRISLPQDQIITSFDWINENEVVLVARDFNENKTLLKFNLSNGISQELIPKTVSNLGFVSVEEGQIFFESSESGIDNIYLLTPEGSRKITTSRYGAYAPEFSGGKLIYNDYSEKGMNIVQKTSEYSTKEESSNSFYPIYEKFSKSENIQQFELELLKETDLPETKNYSQTANAINLHSWVLLAPPLSASVTAIGLSRDILNKFTLGAGANYNLNERTLQGFATAAWSHLYTAFDLRAGYGSRRDDFIIAGNEIDNKWEEGTLEAGVSIPWQYLQGRFSHSFTVRAFSTLIKVTNKLSNDLTEVTDGVLFSPGAEMSYAWLSRTARRDLNPEYGFTVDGRFEEGKDISGRDMKGRLVSGDSRLFLPGLWHHHSFFHQFAYEKQNDLSYQYESRVLYPRGTKNFFLDEFTKYSANYSMPLFYPDWNLSRYFYLRRISLNLFYDELNGRLLGFPYKAASTGWETIFETSVLRLAFPLSIGVRGSYLINGIERRNNYEVFLATNVVQF